MSFSARLENDTHLQAEERFFRAQDNKTFLDLLNRLWTQALKQSRGVRIRKVSVMLSDLVAATNLQAELFAIVPDADVKVGTRRVRQSGTKWHPRPEDDGLALGVAVKPHTCGVPLTRFQGLTAPPGQESTYAVYAKKWIFPANELQSLLTLSERSNPNFLT